ncbi:MAG: cytidylate kinase [Deltaproteobacteria bacterium RBG_16_49_23]|nr:MAG: cytidylate kinase [Deltaproteobacteria bacterium RBG_16_49_23]
MEEKKLIIAIDGPSGAGKSTVGKNLAKRLGYLYIDTGAMYRAVALKAKERGIEPEDEMALSQLVSSIQISFVTRGDETRVLCDGEDITHAIRSPEISRLASDISKSKRVREGLVEMQRKMGKEGGVVLEGRDIGTVVFPDADLKFYLDADPEERGRRRYREFSEKGMKVEFNETLKEVVERDRNDMSRSLSPLKRAEDAILIDSTCRSVEEVVREMCRIAHEKRRWSEIDYR